MEAVVAADPDQALPYGMPTTQPANEPDDAKVPTMVAFAGAVFILLGLWWVFAALSDVLRDLDLAGSIVAVSVPDLLNPLVSPKRAAEMVRVWRDWDASLGVSERDLRSGVVLTVWLAIDVLVAGSCGIWARSRTRMLTPGRTGPQNREHGRAHVLWPWANPPQHRCLLRDSSLHHTGERP